jgi:hypothetical protein
MKMARLPDGKAVTLLIAAAAMALLWFLLNPPHPDRVTIHSKELGENRSLLVRLPARYNAGKGSYPLLVLLDGGDRKQFAGDKPLYSRSKEVLAVLEKKGFAPMIMVGIDNRDRVRDMTPIQRPDIYVGGGGARAFMEFIETEVLPFAERRWRIGSTRILYGESYGGLFVLDALARGGQAFSDYIAVSPTIGVWPQGLADAFRRRFNRSSAARSLYIVYGEKDAPLVVGHTIPFLREIEGFLPSGFRKCLDILSNEGHNPSRSLELGLRFVFSEQAQ